MEILEAICKRRSVRVFEDKEVSQEVIKEIIEASKYYPSWKNTQTARFIAIYDKDLKDKIANNAVLGFDHNKEIISKTPVLMVLATVNGRSGYERDGSPTTSKGSHFQSFDAGAAAYTFQLAAYAKGLGSVVLGIYDEEKIKEYLNMGEDMSVSCLIPLGYGNLELPAPPRKSVDDLLIIK